uniref:Uncharacterized protein n=1 Tax=Heliothis virescens TaxID=7102 RepID=A0A2A4JDJ3_HELVI
MSRFTAANQFRGLEEAVNAIAQEESDNEYDVIILPPEPDVLTDEEEGEDDLQTSEMPLIYTVENDIEESLEQIFGIPDDGSEDGFESDEAEEFNVDTIQRLLESEDDSSNLLQNSPAHSTPNNSSGSDNSQPEEPLIVQSSSLLEQEVTDESECEDESWGKDFWSCRPDPDEFDKPEEPLIVQSSSLLEQEVTDESECEDESWGKDFWSCRPDPDEFDKMRRVKGAVTMSELQDEIRKKMCVGTNEEDALARLSEQQTLKAITLSINTRGIGLGLLESNIEAIKSELPVVPRLNEHIKQPGVSSDMLRVAQSVTIVRDWLCHVKYEDKVYIPAVAADPIDRHGAVTPRPENVLLSTLRRTVVYLSNSASSATVRRRFHENCPISGAIWTNDILQNPDEIMPQNYDLYEDFRRESMLIAPFLVSLQKHVPKLVGGTLDFKSNGHNSLLISNELQTLKTVDRHVSEDLQDYYRRCVPEGNVRNYTALARLTPAERVEGQVNLLGEYPPPVNLRYPMYHMRDELAAAYDVTSDYAGICQIMYAM